METVAPLAMVALFALALRLMRGPKWEPTPPPPGVDPGARCETCGHYQWPAACPCVVAQRKATAEEG